MFVTFRMLVRSFARMPLIPARPLGGVIGNLIVLALSLRSKEVFTFGLFPVSEKGQGWIAHLLLNTVVYTAEDFPMGMHLSLSLSSYKFVRKQIPAVEMPNSGLDTTKQTLKQKQIFHLILSHVLQLVVTSNLDCWLVFCLIQ